MGWSESQLMRLIANAEENGHTQDIPHWTRLLEQVRHDNRTAARK